MGSLLAFVGQWSEYKEVFPGTKLSVSNKAQGIIRLKRINRENDRFTDWLLVTSFGQGEMLH